MKSVHDKILILVALRAIKTLQSRAAAVNVYLGYTFTALDRLQFLP